MLRVFKRIAIPALLFMSFLGTQALAQQEKAGTIPLVVDRTAKLACGATVEDTIALSIVQHAQIYGDMCRKTNDEVRMQGRRLCPSNLCITNLEIVYEPGSVKIDTSINGKILSTDELNGKMFQDLFSTKINWDLVVRKIQEYQRGSDNSFLAESNMGDIDFRVTITAEFKLGPTRKFSCVNPLDHEYVKKYVNSLWGNPANIQKLQAGCEGTL
jgi:hypothetical protein